MTEYEVLIIGCGIAGATAALRLAQHPHIHVTLVTRTDDPLESATRYAQGGIVGRGKDDNAEALVNDILRAGAGASSPTAARILAEEGPTLLQEILVTHARVQFDTQGPHLWEYGLEAAHSHRRILHVGDRTGQAIIQGLMQTLSGCSNVTLMTGATVVDLITFPHHSSNPLDVYQPVECYGAYIFHAAENRVRRHLAHATILATGGLGQIFRNTTNPAGTRGDGIVMAHRAGARIVNAEYIQFHPTALSVPGANRFLISEAVRGEGGVLLSPNGHPFMEKYEPQWKDLAPRDVVARAIHHEMVLQGYPHVLLEIASKLSPEKIRERFPTIYQECLKCGIDITRDPIPVAPAAHYFCGGVAVDEWGRSSIANLYAIGEVSCTGLHGANRLASTSLLEGLVWGNRSANHITRWFDERKPKNPLKETIPEWFDRGVSGEADPALIQGDLQTVQNIMWHYVGLVRNAERLSRAIRELRHLWSEIENFYRTTKLSDGLIGLRNAVEVALLVAQAARHNHQSRGCHFRQDAER